MDAFGSFVRFKEAVLGEAPEDAAFPVLNLQIARRGCDQPARCVCCAATVVAGKRRQRLGVALNCRLRWALRISHKPTLLAQDRFAPDPLADRDDRPAAVEQLIGNAVG